ncbi:MAG: hypothetical protein ACP5UN_00385 [Candidatus Micrarchaeia archaeon]
MNNKNNNENNMKITEADFEKELRLNQLYLSIISKYKNYIEEKEQRSINDLPSLITPQNNFVLNKANSIKENFQQYNYEKDFYNACLKAFEFVQKEIDKVIMPIRYWLTPEETLLFKLGDIFDKNTLLISLLIALGNYSSKVVLVISNSEEKTFSYCEYNNQILFFDIEKRIYKYKNIKKGLDSLNLSIDENSMIYEFNNHSINIINYK